MIASAAQAAVALYKAHTVCFDTDQWRAVVEVRDCRDAVEFWPLRDALHRSIEISNFDLLERNIESGRVQLCHSDAETWRQWASDRLVRAR